MAARIIDGKEIAREVRAEVKARAHAFCEAYGETPALAVVLVGEDPASQVYVANKQKACGWVGIRSVTVRLPETATEDEVLSEIARLNADASISGILVQLPLPRGMNADRVTASVAPEKDVDGFHPINAGRLLRGRAPLEPCTPAGCVRLLKKAGVPLSGANAVVIGRSNIVGKPLAMMLLRENCTVTICHSRTENLADFVRRADIVVSAVGHPRMITAEMVKPGAAVIDVGINRLPDGTLTGDVDFEGVCEVTGWITPVPGGVGPMTIAMLLKNTMDAAENARSTIGTTNNVGRRH